MVIWSALVWIAGIELKQLGLILLVSLLILVIGFQFLQPYQQERVTGFLISDPNATYGAQYNVDQALIALGSGGLLGKGYGLGTQTQFRFLKVRHTDFIFSVVAEEFGIGWSGLCVIVDRVYYLQMFAGRKKSQ